MKPISVHLTIIFCIAAISACTLGPVPFFQSPTATPTSTPTPLPSPTLTPIPPFNGTLLLRINTGYADVVDIHALTYYAKTWTTTSTPLIEGAGRTMLSPDGTRLFMYKDEDQKVKVIDLLSNEETSFEIPEGLGDENTASISPDNTKICYTTFTGNVYLYNISLGKSWLLYKAPSSNYSYSGGTKTFVHGDTRCGLWLGADRFVFYRYIGAMPSKVTFPGYDEVAINTTTMVTIDGKPKLEDIKQWLSVEAISVDGLSVVYLDKKDGSVYLVPNFSSFKNLESQLLFKLKTKGHMVFFEFLPDNQLLYAESEYRSSGSLVYPDYAMINLKNLEFSEWNMPDECGSGFDRNGGWNRIATTRTWQWVGKPGSGKIACVTDVGTGSHKVFEVSVVDVTTGLATPIFKLEGGSFAEGGEIIGWLP
jgi:hypothetical protein